ncbi:MAG: hypothetical protein ACR2OJ_14925 [Hyphomicrobiales bacterium]
MNISMSLEGRFVKSQVDDQSGLRDVEGRGKDFGLMTPSNLHKDIPT